MPSKVVVPLCFLKLLILMAARAEAFRPRNEGVAPPTGAGAAVFQEMTARAPQPDFFIDVRATWHQIWSDFRPPTAARSAIVASLKKGGMIMKGILTLVPCLVLLLAASLAQASATPTPSPGLDLNAIERMVPNGSYVIQVFDGAAWRDAGRISCDRFFRKQTIDLTAALPANTKATWVRLREQGGGAAHIDAVLLDGIAPSEVRGTDQPMALQKAAAGDYDVIDAFGKTLEFSFPAGAGDATLTLVARIEGKRIDTTPFQFPLANLFREMTPASAFYSYALDAARGVDAAKPFFQEFSQTGSGHPSGFTYGWVWNDDQHLYVRMDFTPDDTMDGSKDYAKVYVKTAAGLKSFKVSVPETTWGSPSFTYTDKVPWQHKVYNFQIPLAEIGMPNATSGGKLELAFAAYGTATPGKHLPALPYDAQNNRYLVIYVKYESPNYTIEGQLINPDGTLHGSGNEFLISGNADGMTFPTIAYDQANAQFLVVWNTSSTADAIYGQLVSPDGILIDGVITLSSGAGDRLSPAVAFDSSAQRYLIVWQDLRNDTGDIYGQILAADKTTIGDNFLISTNSTPPPVYAPDRQQLPSVVYESGDHAYLVTWTDYRGGAKNEIYGQRVGQDGSLLGNNFVIASPADPKHAEASKSAYDPVHQRSFTAWFDPAIIPMDLMGQLRTADGPTGDDILIASNATVDNPAVPPPPEILFEAGQERFILTWRPDEIPPLERSRIDRRFVAADGTPEGDVLTIVEEVPTYGRHSLAYNTLCLNTLIAYTLLPPPPETQPASLDFLPIGDCDAEIPTATPTQPVDGEDDVATTTTLTATFSRAMRASTINPDTFTLTTTNDVPPVPVTGAVTYDAASNTATFTLPTDVPLMEGVEYTATLTTGIQDEPGHHLAADVVWRFTTLVTPPTPSSGGCALIPAR
jgi:Bacterial Ig-like domain